MTTGADQRYRIEPGQPPSVAVVKAVADVEDTPAEDLVPLAAAVNPDALDELFRGEPADQYRFSFSYAGHRVVVSGGHVVVREGDHEAV